MWKRIGNYEPDVDAGGTIHGTEGSLVNRSRKRHSLPSNGRPGRLISRCEAVVRSIVHTTCTSQNALLTKDRTILIPLLRSAHVGIHHLNSAPHPDGGE